jgi:hypothetical protein
MAALPSPIATAFEPNRDFILTLVFHCPHTSLPPLFRPLLLGFSLGVQAVCVRGRTHIRGRTHPPSFTTAAHPPPPSSRIRHQSAGLRRQHEAQWSSVLMALVLGAAHDHAKCLQTLHSNAELITLTHTHTHMHTHTQTITRTHARAHTFIWLFSYLHFSLVLRQHIASLPFKCRDALSSAIVSHITRRRYNGPVASYLKQAVCDFASLHSRFCSRALPNCRYLFSPGVLLGPGIL